MSEFKKLQNSVEALAVLLNEIASTSDADTQELAKKHAQIKELYELCVPKVSRFRARAQEQDPDKRIYGPAMVTKIMDCAKFFDEQEERYTGLVERLENAVAAEKTREKDALKSQQELEEQRLVALKEQREKQKLDFQEEKKRSEDLAKEKLRKEQEAIELLQKRAQEKMEMEEKERIRAREEAAAKETQERERIQEEREKHLEKVRRAADEQKQKLVDIARRVAQVERPECPVSSASTMTSEVGTTGTPSEDPFGTSMLLSVMDDATFRKCVDYSCSGKTVVFVFYVTWSSSSKKLLDFWKQTRSSNEGLRIGIVDCDRSPKLAQQNKVRSFPTIFFYQDGKLEQEVLGTDQSKMTSVLDSLRNKKNGP